MRPAKPKYDTGKILKEAQRRKRAQAKGQLAQAQLENEHLKMQNKLTSMKLQVVQAKVGGVSSGSQKKN